MIDKTLKKTIENYRKNAFPIPLFSDVMTLARTFFSQIFVLVYPETISTDVS